jgi:Antibiotic biosynthesis monooxygenase
MQRTACLVFPRLRAFGRQTRPTRLSAQRVAFDPWNQLAPSLAASTYISTRKAASGTFFIHSTWKDEGAFDAHAQFPHMKRFLGLLGDLVTNPVKAVRTRQMD